MVIGICDTFAASLTSLNILTRPWEGEGAKYSGDDSWVLPNNAAALEKQQDSSREHYWKTG